MRSGATLDRDRGGGGGKAGGGGDSPFTRECVAVIGGFMHGMIPVRTESLSDPYQNF